jgi:hypothetical protein
MNQENIAMTAAVLAATVLTGAFTTTTFVYADSTTNQVITNRQHGEASGDATNNFCANNLIESGNGELPENVGSCTPEGEESNGPPPPPPP